MLVKTTTRRLCKKALSRQDHCQYGVHRRSASAVMTACTSYGPLYPSALRAAQSNKAAGTKHRQGDSSRCVAVASIKHSSSVTYTKACLPSCQPLLSSAVIACLLIIIMSQHAAVAKPRESDRARSIYSSNLCELLQSSNI